MIPQPYCGDFEGGCPGCCEPSHHLDEDEEALVLCGEKIFAEHTDDGFAHLILGLARQRRGEIEAAILDYSRGISLQPDLALGLYLRGTPIMCWIGLSRRSRITPA